MASVQFGAALAWTIFDEVGAAGVTLLRVTFAAVLLLAFWRPAPRAYTARELRLVALFGLVIGAMNLCLYESIARIPLGVAVTVEFVGPLGVAVALSRRRLDLAFAALAAVGVVLLADPGGGRVDALGVVLALAAAACWAAYILLSSITARVFRGGQGLALAMAVAVLVPLGPGVAGAGSDLLDPRWLAIGFAVAALSSAVAYSMETEALRRIPRRVFGVLMSLQPAVAAVAGLVVLGQRLSLRELAAVVMVVGASVGATRQAAAVVPEA
jgi:inner membrane transporter RhtA